MLEAFTILIHIINMLTIIFMIFKEKRSANSIIAWTLILYLAPVLGFIIFILVGRRINQSNMYAIKEQEQKIFNEYIEYSRSGILLKGKNYKIEDKDMIMALENLDFSPYRDNNDIDLYSDGKEFFSELLESLKKAKKSINIQFYIFRADGLGKEILNVLEEKAKEGVEVRLIYDSLGSKSLKKSDLASLIEAGGKVGEFFPSWLKIININLNYRNHRKIVVIDKKVAFVGGFNVGDEYLGKDKKFGYWRDTHIKIEGSAVKDLNIRFLADWRYTSKEKLDLQKALAEELLNTKSQNKGEHGLQIVSSGPNIADNHEIKLAYIKMIQKAKEYIYIQTPYFIVDKSISDSLRLAASSGVDVRIMIPGKGDHPFVYWANLGFVGDLLKSGVKVYHYDRNAFLHAKTVVTDDSICSVGTANMDTRSFELNFEVNAFIYSKEIAVKQREEFLKDMLKSEELTLERYESRDRWTRTKEALSRLLSGLL